MKWRHATIRRASAVVLLFGGAFVLSALASKETRDPAPLAVHEWGTFTSIAGPDGTAMLWYPLSGPQDLPCFVERIRLGIKPDLAGTIRMETPVLYFYAPQDTTVNVTVKFRQGFVTEWFPRATVTPAVVEPTGLRDPNLVSSITWKNVRVAPGASADYPTEQSPSHYYAARETDASPLQSGTQQEKFLFYRGVGRFPPPLTARIAGGKVRVASPEGEPIGDLILFENRGRSIGYRLTHAANAEIDLDPTVPAASVQSLRRELERMLVARGLYPKEASAMVETWRDSWFETGMRLFYIPSKKAIDSILPLQVSPVPTEVARVFVGRMELVTEQTIDEVKDAIVRADGRALRQHGRFLAPMISRILSETSPADRAMWDARVRAAYQAYYAGAPSGVLCR